MKLKKVNLEYDDEFIYNFVEICAKDNLEMGGRGIVNRIETHIKNGLTNFMFKTKKVNNCTIILKIEGKQIVIE